MQRGDIVRAQGKRGKYKLRTEMTRCADDGRCWWALSMKTGKVHPIRIKESK